MADYDLGMLRVFVFVYETRSVTAAAERLYISQPSVSYTLRKLRKLFGDQLFVRTGQGLEPTAVAEGLYPRLRQLLESIDEVMSGAKQFRPEQCTRTFRLRLTDVGVNGLLPRILHRLRSEAPHVVLDVGALRFSSVIEELRLGQADAAICATRLSAPELLRDPLFAQPYLGVCATDHPRVGPAPSLEDFQAEQHLAVAVETGHRTFETRLRDLDIEWRVAVTVPSFSALPMVLAGTELLSYAPATVARRYEASGVLRVFELPFDLPASESALYTMRRALPSAEIDWFRTCLIEALSQ